MATLTDDRARRFEDTNFTPVDRVIVRVQPELIFDHR